MTGCQIGMHAWLLLLSDTFAVLSFMETTIEVCRNRSKKREKQGKMTP